MKIRLLLLSISLTACAQFGPQKSEPAQPTAKPVAKAVQPKPKAATADVVVFGVMEESLKAIPLDDPLAETYTDKTCLPVQDELSRASASAESLVKELGTKISKTWIKPRNISKTYQCNVSLGLSEQGCISDVKVSGCNENKTLVRSIETAIYRAAPYPKIDNDQLNGELVFQFVANP